MYRVYWGPDLIAQISAAYRRADRLAREAILAAVESIDAALSQKPMETGESRESDQVRVVIKGPVAVTFRVDVEKQFVRVSSVNIFERD